MKRARFKGTVKWFNFKNGYGFIQPDDGGQDVFIHITALKEAGLARLDTGDKVEYEIVNVPNNQNGRVCASQIQKIDD